MPGRYRGSWRDEAPEHSCVRPRSDLQSAGLVAAAVVHHDDFPLVSSRSVSRYEHSFPRLRSMIAASLKAGITTDTRGFAAPAPFMSAHRFEVVGASLRELLSAERRKADSVQERGQRFPKGDRVDGAAVIDRSFPKTTTDGSRGGTVLGKSIILPSACPDQRIRRNVRLAARRRVARPHRPPGA